jgi:hypothetical protein
VELKPDAPSRSVTEVTQGDYVQTRHGWERIVHNSVTGAKLPTKWIIITTNGEYDMWGILKYAKAEDFQVSPEARTPGTMAG